MTFPFLPATPSQPLFDLSLKIQRLTCVDLHVCHPPLGSFHGLYAASSYSRAETCGSPCADSPWALEEKHALDSVVLGHAPLAVLGASGTCLCAPVFCSEPIVCLGSPVLREWAGMCLFLNMALGA